MSVANVGEAFSRSDRRVGHVRAQPSLSNLWERTATKGEHYPSLRGRTETSVAIIGGGYAGLSTALHLAERGVAVVLLEAETPGAGASGRNGGQVILGLRHRPEDLQSVYGAELGRRAFDFGARAATTTFDLIKRHAIACDAAQTGWVQAADTLAGIEQCGVRVSAWRREGVPVELLDRAEIRALTGSDAYLGGWVDPGSGTVQPLSYVRGLAGAAKRAGARVFGGSRAVAVERFGAEWRVRTAEGEVTAPKLLIATNATERGLWPGLRRTILPAWSYQIATWPLDTRQRASVIPGGEGVSDTRRVLRYFRVDRDHRLIVGGKGTSHAPRALGDFSLQRHFLARLYPELADIETQHAWGGEVAITPDRLPRILSLGPGAYANLGCNGKGVAWSTAIGSALADAFIDDDPASLPIPVTEIQTIPFHALRRVYVGAGSAWLRARDLLDQGVAASPQPSSEL